MERKHSVHGAGVRRARGAAPGPAVGRGLAAALACASAALVSAGACRDPGRTAPELPLRVTPDSVTVAWGDTVRLAAEGSGPVRWSSADTTVARVDAGGVVTPVRAGAARIEARADARAGHATVVVVARFAEVAAGADASCGVVPAGRVLCWGAPLDTATARAFWGERYTHAVTSPRPAPPTERALAIRLLRLPTLAADPVWSYACAIVAAGGARCWGAAEYGQQGVGVVGQGTQLPPTALGGPAPLVDVALGYRHACGLAAGGVAHCWGLGALGHAQRNATCPYGGSRGTACQTVPAPVATALRFASIAPGGVHTCAVSLDGRLHCWGTGWAAGHPGGPFHEYATPTAIDTATYATVTAGQAHACATTPAGELRCWGENDRGQLGRVVADSAAHARPTAVDPVEGAGAPLRVRGASAGTGFTCAVATDARVHCWGDNRWGQLGDGTTASRARPAPVRSVRRFVAVSAGTTHACAVAEDGATFCWGDNRRGQLGNGTTASSSLPVRVGAPR